MIEVVLKSNVKTFTVTCISYPVKIIMLTRINYLIIFIIEGIK